MKYTDWKKNQSQQIKQQLQILTTGRMNRLSRMIYNSIVNGIEPSNYYTTNDRNNYNILKFQLLSKVEEINDQGNAFELFLDRLGDIYVASNGELIVEQPEEEITQPEDGGKVTLTFETLDKNNK